MFRPKDQDELSSECKTSEAQEKLLTDSGERQEGLSEPKELHGDLQAPQGPPQSLQLLSLGPHFVAKLSKDSTKTI